MEYIVFREIQEVKIMTDEMMKDYIEKWLDYRIKVHTEYLNHMDLPFCYGVCDNAMSKKEIHVFDVPAICKALNMGCHIKEREDKEYGYICYFTYKGMKFFSLHTDEKCEIKPFHGKRTIRSGRYE